MHEEVNHVLSYSILDIENILRSRTRILSQCVSRTQRVDTVNHDTIPPHDSGFPEIQGGGEPSAHVVLFQPEIPQNTGNIGRSCVAVNAKLWIVEPAAFEISDKRVRRAGLDYWPHLQLEMVPNWETLTHKLESHRFFFFSKFAKRSVWDASFEKGDVFVFGRESSGLPASILDPDDPRSLRLPTTTHVRSLNLATTVGITLYEQQRQLFGTATIPLRNS